MTMSTYGNHLRLRALLVTVLGVLTLGVSVAFSTEASADVQSAYQREFAFLEAEKSSLQQRLRDFQTQSQAKIDAAKGEVEALQGRALAVAASADRMTESLSGVETELDTAAEDEDLIESMLTQAQATLEKGNLKLPEAAENDPQASLKQLDFAFGAALGMLDRQSRVLREDGEFYNVAGERIEGTLLRVGQVASFGVGDSAAGALAPAGEGRLKLWPEGATAATARALVSGNAPPVVGMFLYESLEKGVEAKKSRTAMEEVEAGGLIGWVIVGLGGLAGLMALARVFLLLRAAANTNKLTEEIRPLLEQHKIADAISSCKRAKNASGRVLVATLQNLDRDRHELEDIISEAVLHEQPALDRFGSAIIVVAAVAPLLGLLGTVTGMIATFDIITEFGTGNPKLLSGGISIALVTTELGLIVAIPALIIGNLLSGWAESIKDGLDKAALRVVNIASGIRISKRPSEPPQQELADTAGSALAGT